MGCVPSKTTNPHPDETIKSLKPHLANQEPIIPKLQSTPIKRSQQPKPPVTAQNISNSYSELFIPFQKVLAKEPQALVPEAKPIQKKPKQSASVSKQPQNRLFPDQKPAKQQPQPFLSSKFQPDKKQQVNKESLKVEQIAKDECPICLAKNSDTKTICNHTFCSTCIQQAVRIKNYCPLCRHFNPLSNPQNADGQHCQLNQSEWNIQMVRRVIKVSISDETNQIYLQGQEGIQPSNVFVSKNAKIKVAPGTNLWINGKKVQNPQQCNQQ